ncbi:MAG: beta-lactamase family protein [Myxococcales bacterium]|nr:beta-lactamase family protein [Myxococcales bacterium]
MTVSDATARALLMRLAQAQRVGRVPSLVAGVVRGGELCWTGARGEATGGPPPGPDLQYRIGSITKTFTATAMLQLRDAGVVDLDAPVATVVPAFERLRYPFAEARAIRFADLLTHSSGLPRLGRVTYWEPDAPPTAAELRASLEAIALVRAPGSDYEYSNLGFALLGLAIAELTGVPAREQINRRILTPLGMEATVWDADAVPAAHRALAYERGDQREALPRPLWAMGVNESAGGLFSSVNDLARYAAWQLDAWPPRNDPDDPVLSRASRREAQTIRFAYGGDEFGARGVGWAWHMRTECGIGRRVQHGGGTDGFAAELVLLPDHGVAVIVLSNIDDAKPKDYGDGIVTMLADTGGLSRRSPVPSPEVEAAADRFTALLRTWSSADYEDLLAPVARIDHGPERAATELDWWRARLGPCERGPLLAATGLARASYRLRCETAAATLEVNAQLGAPTRLFGYRIHSAAVAPDDAVLAAAHGVEALIHDWNDDDFARLFAPHWSAEGMHEFLAGIGETRGACHVGEVLDVDGPGRGEFELLCDQASMRLRIHLRPADADAPGTIASLLIRPRQTKNRCPRDSAP